MIPEKKAYLEKLNAVLNTGYAALDRGSKSGFAKGVAKIMADVTSFKAGKGTVFCKPGKNEFDLPS